MPIKMLLAAALLVLATAASAQTAAPDDAVPGPGARGRDHGGPGRPHPVHAACMEDVKKLCPGVQPGEGRIRACMKEHRNELSAGCQSAIKERMSEHRAQGARLHPAHGSNNPATAPAPAAQ